MLVGDRAPDPRANERLKVGGPGSARREGPAAHGPLTLEGELAEVVQLLGVLLSLCALGRGVLALVFERARAGIVGER